MTPNQRWRINNREKGRAHAKIENARKAGKITPQPCQTCGATERLHAHHDDYSKPFDVRWLCTVCHRKLHANLKGRRPKPTHITKNYPKIKRERCCTPSKRVGLIGLAEKLREQGHSYKKIALELKVSKGTIYKWLNNTSYK